MNSRVNTRIFLGEFIGEFLGDLFVICFGVLLSIIYNNNEPSATPIRYFVLWLKSFLPQGSTFGKQQEQC